MLLREIMELFDLVVGVLLGFLMANALRAALRPPESFHDGDALGDQDEDKPAEIASEAD